VVASAAYLRSRKAFHAILVDYVFVNPPGITRYVSEQTTRGLRQSLTGVAQMIAQRLGARDYRRVSYVDSVVHEHGEAGWSVFLEHLDVERIAEELSELASRGCLLVFSDHGYDVVLDEEGGLYVTHGYKLEAGEGRVILPLSRFSFVLVVFPAS
jgi:NADPH:quinone reductase-like Zn-dependent oxidoreductase